MCLTRHLVTVPKNENAESSWFNEVSCQTHIISPITGYTTTECFSGMRRAFRRRVPGWSWSESFQTPAQVLSQAVILVTLGLKYRGRFSRRPLFLSFFQLPTSYFLSTSSLITLTSDLFSPHNSDLWLICVVLCWVLRLQGVIRSPGELTLLPLY